MYAILTRIDDVAPNIRTFWFKPEGRARYIAGQFVEFYLLHDNCDDRGQRRWFTLSSSPSEDMISITTKFAAENGSSFKQALAELPIGYRAMFSEPMGDFVLPKDPAIPLIFVAGGIGVTPMRSMIKYLLDTGERRDVSLLYGARSAKEIAFRDMFTSYCGTQFKTFTEQPMTSQDIISVAHAKPESLIYLAGPEPMVEKYVAELKQAGVSNHRLVTDYFPGYPAA